MTLHLYLQTGAEEEPQTKNLNERAPSQGINSIVSIDEFCVFQHTPRKPVDVIRLNLPQFCTTRTNGTGTFPPLPVSSGGLFTTFPVDCPASNMGD